MESTSNHDADYGSFTQQREIKGLSRGLSSRQVQMIAIGGTIGTGLFLGSGKSLAEGGPASLLLCYGLVGFIVYVTLMLLGEMATHYPVAGKSPPCLNFPCHSIFLGRVVQLLRHTILFSFVRFRSVLELLAQRCRVSRV
jgi:hypothetical protein